MEKELKTIEQWLNELPETYKTQAIENTRSLRYISRLNDFAPSLKDALAGSFIWDESSQGHFYWETLYNSL